MGPFAETEPASVLLVAFLVLTIGWLLWRAHLHRVRREDRGQRLPRRTAEPVRERLGGRHYAAGGPGEHFGVWLGMVE